jgi:large subunit ribosomal protein L4
MDASTFTKTGTKATTAAKLNKTVFGVTPKNHDLLKQAYVTYLANGRENLAVTKTRGLVRGGGKKPWRQKGTGRARVGSSRVPNWRGGGAVFAPTGKEHYAKHLNVKAKRLAIRQALSLAAKNDKLKVIETFECKDGKAGETANLLKKIGASGRILIVVSQKDAPLKRATRNLPEVNTAHATYLNVHDVLNADTIVLSQKAVDNISAWLGGEQS